MLINLKTILLLESQTDLCKIFINEMKRTTAAKSTLGLMTDELI